MPYDGMNDKELFTGEVKKGQCTVDFGELGLKAMMGKSQR